MAGVVNSFGDWETGSNPRSRPINNRDGLLMNLRAFRVAEMFDGTSNTVSVEEVTGGEPGSARRVPRVH